MSTVDPNKNPQQAQEHKSSHSAQILADSISPEGRRLTTMLVEFPRCVLAEFNTHRVLTRNSASSRAIPIERMLERLALDPFIPDVWGRNQKGMQAGEPLNHLESQLALTRWLWSRNDAMQNARELLTLGVHKQIVNRMLEPYMWHVVIVTATDWDNLFHLCCHPDASSDFQKVARAMQQARAESTPKHLTYGNWHLPFIEEVDFENAILNPRFHFHRGGVPCHDPQGVQQFLKKVSTGRCARVSYRTHDGRCDPQEDERLHDRLLNNGHLSPFEHVARPMTQEELVDHWRWLVELEDGRTISTSYGAGLMATTNGALVAAPSSPPKGLLLHGSRVKRVLTATAYAGNFNGWMQYRKTIPFEFDILHPKEDPTEAKNQ